MSWLEPAVGVGNFFGRQPEALLAGARRVGMDKDPLTSQIAKYLYPDSGIETKAFEEAELPDNYFDAAISNVPFGNFGVYDPAYKKKPYLTSSIHNYFFAKSLDVVRPGGIVAFVTSRYTLDGYEQGHKLVREHLGKHADFLGAVRLPSNAFLQSSVRTSSPTLFSCASASLARNLAGRSGWTLRARCYAATRPAIAALRPTSTTMLTRKPYSAPKS